MSCRARSLGKTLDPWRRATPMALADLRALAQRWALARSVAAVTQSPLLTGYELDDPKTKENRRPIVSVTAVTPATTVDTVLGETTWPDQARSNEPVPNGAGQP